MVNSVRIRTLFVADAIGATLSAFLLGVVLMRLEHIFGMPQDALVVLAALPIGFACYDIYCLATGRAEQAGYLVPIGLLNLSYCGISATYVVLHARSLSWLGWLYFVGEIVLVFGLAIVELRAAQRPEGA